ncbi:MAG: MaoC family dehydratase [Deltaproteobacteria bacterium]|nr:MAG: MaoC family dehydratase [Deltaproteobacteria bacterium]TMA52495.1 MAG: MaoC family dehydratase [Deltaproteobacteria bacterium]TMB17724.1 MAG: MaoC family dehydratase [Deltaproteobacteria bacterium]
MEEIRFDDVEKLRTKISDAFSEWSESIEVTQDMINRFAELTGDHQWIHVDVERAKRESPFRTTIAHGFLTLSLLPCMHSNPSWKIAGYGNATNYGADKLRFVSPVPAGAKVHARSRLVAVEGRPQGTQVKQEIQVQVVGQERPALIYEMLVLYHPPMKRAAG